MAKNRFNTRASWDTNFKYSGQLMPKAPKVSNLHKEKMTAKTRSNISNFYQNVVDRMNDWEAGFIKSIIEKGFILSPKQKV